MRTCLLRWVRNEFLVIKWSLTDSTIRSCLSGARSTCRVCGNIFDRSAISKLLMLYGNTPRRSSITTSEEEYSRIQGEITSLNLDTPISRLDHVHAQGRYFLESQPRSLVRHH